MNTIDFVVVLMLENRSFDHLFGFSPGVNGLKGTEFNLENPLKPESPTNAKFKVGANASNSIAKGKGPGHSLHATNIQLTGIPTGPDAQHPVKLNGFIQSYLGNLAGDKVHNPTPAMVREPMQSFSPDRLPSLNQLANEFVLCDNWFSEMPGPTQPNRLYTHCATSGGFAYNDWQRIVPDPTVYNLLEDKQKTWAVYYSDDNDVAKFDRLAAKAYTTPEEEAEFESDRANGVRGAFLDYKTFFKQHAQSGKLSTYNFIEPAFGDSPETSNTVDSMHAPHDVRPGDLLVADVYEALRGNQSVWNRTLLIVTFDEHGGFFDHVVPPAAANPDGINAQENKQKNIPAFAFDRLGLRVPAILVSPLLPKGKIVSDQYQHTSIISTLRTLFGLEKPLTKRDAAAQPCDKLLTTTLRQDAPLKLKRVEISAEHAMAMKAEATQPEKLDRDELLKEKAEGWRNIVATQIGEELPAPTTVQEAHQVIRDAVKQYSRWHFERQRSKK